MKSWVLRTNCSVCQDFDGALCYNNWLFGVNFGRNVIDVTEIVKIFLAFIVLINPSGALGLFLQVTKDYDDKESKKIAQIACVAVFVAIAVFAVLGELLLKALGISLGSFRVAGGILLLLIAIGMMSGGSNPVKPKGNEVDVQTSSLTAVAVVPIAIPMIMGPGGISTVIIYSSHVQGIVGIAIILAIGLVISVFCYACLMAAGKISRFLGETGLNILGRIMGMLLAAVAVEVFIAGLKMIFPQLA